MPKAVYVQKGENINFTNTTVSEIGYMDIVQLPSRIGVALEPIAVNATGSVSVTGVYDLPADNTTAFATGDALYWASGKVVKTAGGVSAGFAVADKALAGTIVSAKIG